jgi:hypothetical protein
MPPASRYILDVNGIGIEAHASGKGVKIKKDMVDIVRL